MIIEKKSPSETDLKKGVSSLRIRANNYRLWQVPCSSDQLLPDITKPLSTPYLAGLTR